MTEIWRPVLNYEGFYEVSNFGRVKSLARVVTYSRGGRIDKLTVKEKIVVTPKDRYGYPTVYVSKDSKVATLKVHRVVAMAFVDGSFPGAQVNHKNGIKTDNRPENLEWTTASQNMKHSFDALGRITASRKLTEAQVLEIRSLKESGQHYKEIAKKFGIHPCHVNAIVSKRCWSFIK